MLFIDFSEYLKLLKGGRYFEKEILFSVNDANDNDGYSSLRDKGRRGER